MKKKLIAILLVGTMILLAGCSKGKESDVNDKKGSKETIVVGLDDSFPPMGFRDDDGKIVGFDIDLAKAVAKEMDMKLELKPIDWDGKILSLNNDDVDVLWNGFTITKDRKKEVAFTDAYLANKQVLIVKKDSDIKNKSDLKAKTLGLQLGSSSQNALNSDKNFKDTLENIREYPNNTEALLDLESERLDVVLVDEIVGRYYMGLKKGTYRILKGDLGKEEYGVGVRKDDKEFLKKLNEALDTVKNSDTGKNISKKWFDENILIGQ